MPYIRKTLRNTDPFVLMDTSGDLNYQISKLCSQYILANGLSYKRLNDVIGALEASKQEFYRRIVVPYEDEKIKENGDLEEFERILNERM